MIAGIVSIKSPLFGAGFFVFWPRLGDAGLLSNFAHFSSIPDSFLLGVAGCPLFNLIVVSGLRVCGSVERRVQGCKPSF